MVLKNFNLRPQIQYNHKIIVTVLCIISVTITIQNISLGLHPTFWGGQCTFYNNYIIFKNSFFHLVHGNNLYEFYPKEYGDLFKYSPTFAVGMVFFCYLPDWLGLFIWNTLNILIVYFGLKQLKSIDTKKITLLLLFILMEIILSVQYSQSNALILGLLIFTFHFFESGKVEKATFLIVLGAFIKLFSIAAIVCVFIYPNKTRAIISFFIWVILLFFLPMLFVSFDNLIWQYKNWYVMLKADHHNSNGLSIYEYTKIIFPKNNFKQLTQLIGAFLFITPLFFYKKFKSEIFRLTYLSFMLIWMVVFNHKAETPSYILALTGVGIWGVIVSNKNWQNSALCLLALLFTSIWYSELMPSFLKDSFITLNYIKPLFPTIILFKLLFELTLKRDNELLKNFGNNINSNSN